MAMKNPGRSIRDACLDPLNLSVTEGAERLGVARHTLSRVINGHAGVSPEMAIRFEKMGFVEPFGDRRRGTSGCGAPYAVKGDQRSRRGVAGNGHKVRENGLEHGGILAPPAVRP